jgi:GT2 family glycosyltransferase
VGLLQLLDVTVCIVNWNGQELLRSLLPSLPSAADGLTVEVIVVDNASSDGSADFVAKESPEVKLLRNNRNLGFARAANQAAAAAQGRLLFFLNTDTIVGAGVLTALARVLDENSSMAAVGPRLTQPDGRTQQTNRQNPPRTGAFFHRIFLLRWTGLFRAAYRSFRRDARAPECNGSVMHLSGAALLVRRNQFIEAGGWDESFEFGLEDLDLSLRLRRFGELHYRAETHVQHQGGVSARRNRGYAYYGHECGYARYLGKYHGRWMAIFYKLLVTADMPLRLVVLAARLSVHRALGRKDKALRSRALLGAACEFFFRRIGRYLRS